MIIEHLTSKSEQLQWRRNKVLELSSQGHTERDIAAILQVALGTVNRDLQTLKNLAKANISKYINETLPLEYQKYMVGLDAMLVKVWTILNNSKEISERDRLQALSIGMEAYRMKLDLLTNATVVERAVNFVEKYRGLVTQNSNPSIDSEHNDTAEPIQDIR